MGFAALYPSYNTLLLAMTSLQFGYASAFSRHSSPEVCENLRPLKTEGAGKTGCALHPRSRVQYVHKNTHTSIQVQRRQSGLPCGMVFRLIACSPRRPALLPPSSLRSLLLRNLTPASGRQDHTISPSALAPFVKSAAASTASRTQRP